MDQLGQACRALSAGFSGAVVLRQPKPA